MESNQIYELNILIPGFIQTGFSLWHNYFLNPFNTKCHRKSNTGTTDK